MRIAEPAPTAWDMHFEVFGVPLRIHPWFWGVTALLAFLMPGATAASVALFVAAITVSIIIHECGHAVLAKRFGHTPHMVLYGMGGLAIYRPGRDRWWQRAFVAAGGPGAGFLFGGLVIAIVVLLGYSVTLDPFPLRIGSGDPLHGRLGLFVAFLMFANLFWGLVNLLPIQPLDGGNILLAILTRMRPEGALVLSYKVSIATAIALAVLAMALWGSLILAVMMAMLAYNAWHMLQQIQAAQ